MGDKVKRRIGELLLEDGKLSPENLEEALNHQKKEGGLIGQILIRMGYITEEELIAAIGRQLQIPYIPLSNYSVNMESTLQLEQEYCRRNLMMIFDQDEKNLFLVMGDPLNDNAIDEVKKKHSLKVQLFISTPTEILNMLDLVFNSKEAKKEKKKTG